MSAEKIIKLQTKNHLKGNFTIIIAQIMLVLAAFIAVLCVGGLAASTTGVNSSENIVSAERTAYVIIIFAQYLAAAFLLPLSNGVCRSVCRAVRGCNCRADDVFYYYRNGLGLLWKTLIIDIVSAAIFAVTSFIVCLVTDLPIITAALLADAWDSSPAFTNTITVFAAIVNAAVTASLYVIFVHYTFLAYGFNDRLPTNFYLWRMYGFSMRNFGKALRLIFSFTGWLLLCFFVLPAFYSVPYFLTAAAMSARWAFEADPFMRNVLIEPERRAALC